MRKTFVSPRDGFTLVEILAVIAIIAALATIVTVASTSALAKARDAKRMSALSQLGRFLAGSGCYTPDGGPGDYDIGALYAEVTSRNPQYAQLMPSVPKDPKGGTFAITKYRYFLDESSGDCVLYVNLENANEKVTIPDVSQPSPGRGTGVFASASDGPNGSKLYFQISNK